MAKLIKENNNLKYKSKKEFMEWKYDYHNSGYPICIKTEWEPKDTKEVSVNKEEKMYSEDGD